jgi:catechol 2,3-dioxygenase-like lactoylglutathione lyase family enzyme
MLLVQGFHHVSIPVTDLARAKAFYSGVLGLQEIARPAFDFDGAWYALGDRQLHLIVHPPARALRNTCQIDSRDAHFALRISSYDAALKHLKAHGVAVRERPQNPTPWAQLHITDPDGNGIELNVDRGFRL